MSKRKRTEESEPETPDVREVILAWVTNEKKKSKAEEDVKKYTEKQGIFLTRYPFLVNIQGSVNRFNETGFVKEEIEGKRVFSIPSKNKKKKKEKKKGEEKEEEDKEKES